MQTGKGRDQLDSASLIEQLDIENPLSLKGQRHPNLNVEKNV